MSGFAYAALAPATSTTSTTTSSTTPEPTTLEPTTPEPTTPEPTTPEPTTSEPTTPEPTTPEPTTQEPTTPASTTPSAYPPYDPDDYDDGEVIEYEGNLWIADPENDQWVQVDPDLWYCTGENCALGSALNAGDHVFGLTAGYASSEACESVCPPVCCYACWCNDTEPGFTLGCEAIPECSGDPEALCNFGVGRTPGDGECASICAGNPGGTQLHQYISDNCIPG